MYNKLGLLYLNREKKEKTKEKSLSLRCVIWRKAIKGIYKGIKNEERRIIARFTRGYGCMRRFAHIYVYGVSGGGRRA